MHKNIRNYGERWKSQIQGVSRVQPFPASARKKLMVTVAGGSECGVAGNVTRGGGTTCWWFKGEQQLFFIFIINYGVILGASVGIYAIH